jgi:hypothetical protein
MRRSRGLGDVYKRQLHTQQNLLKYAQSLATCRYLFLVLARKAAAQKK